jgi:hypothetical protein
MSDEHERASRDEGGADPSVVDRHAGGGSADVSDVDHHAAGRADAGESDRHAAGGADAGESDLSPVDRVLPDLDAGEVYAAFIETHEERLADQRASAIEAGRRKGGVAGAAMAGAMFAVAEFYEGPKKDDKPVTVEASSDPEDVDRDGIDVSVGDVDVGSPALPTLGPVVDRANRRKRPQV